MSEPENEKMPEVMVHLSPGDELEKKVPEPPYVSHLQQIVEVLYSIRIYLISFFVMMLIFGLAYTAFLFYALVIRPTSNR